MEEGPRGPPQEPPRGPTSSFVGLEPSAVGPSVHRRSSSHRSCDGHPAFILGPSHRTWARPVPSPQTGSRKNPLLRRRKDFRLQTGCPPACAPNFRPAGLSAAASTIFQRGRPMAAPISTSASAFGSGLSSKLTLDAWLGCPAGLLRKTRSASLSLSLSLFRNEDSTERQREIHGDMA